MLTREETAALPAGLELNALLAEMLLGCSGRMHLRQSEDKPWVPAFPSGQHIGREKTMMLCRVGNQLLTDQSGGQWSVVTFAPPFSTDLAYAWKLIELMRAKGWYSQHTDLTLDSGIEWWAWAFLNHAAPGSQSVSATAETAPLAICRAALLASQQSAPTPAATSTIQKEGGEVARALQ